MVTLTHCHLRHFTWQWHYNKLPLQLHVLHIRVGIVNSYIKYIVREITRWLCMTSFLAGISQQKGIMHEYYINEISAFHCHIA